jgi:hypothetical protein
MYNVEISFVPKASQVGQPPGPPHELPQPKIKAR